MSDQARRPAIRIRFQFNVETGEMELIIDDNAPDRSEDYHDKVAGAIAAFLARHPEIEDAGPIRYRLNREWQSRLAALEKEEEPDEDEPLTE